MQAQPLDDASLVFRAVDGVWRHSSANATKTDSLDAELARTYQALAAVQDRSIGSVALQKRCTDERLAHDLGARRVDVLRPFAHLLRDKRVLVLQAGCGVTCRFVGELAASVVAVVAHPGRASIARLRCEDLKHVDIVCAQPGALAPKPIFDVVVAMGCIDRSLEPQAHAWLQRAQQWLCADGLLLLGAANALALSHLAKDATPIPLRPKRGRMALQQTLHAAGFAGQQLFYAFPSLHRAQAVVTPTGAQSTQEALAPVIRELVEPPSRAEGSRNFCEESMWPQVLANGLLAELAPAFVVLARTRPFAAQQACVSPEHLVYSYATDRPAQFHKESILCRCHSGHEILRRRLYPQMRPAHDILTQRLTDEALPRGKNMRTMLAELLNNPGWSAAAIATWAKPWVNLLVRNQRNGKKTPQGVVPGHFIDVAPGNLSIGPHGSLEAFSLEWDAGEDVPTPWVLFRGLHQVLRTQTSVAKPAKGEAVRVEALVQRVMGHLQIPVDDDTCTAFLAREAQTFGSSKQDLLARELRVRS